MVREDVDWKNQPRHLFDWLFVALLALLTSVYVYLGLVRDETGYLAVGGVLVGYLGMYFTNYWQPILYLVGAVSLLPFTIFWAMTEGDGSAAVLAALVLNSAFVLLAMGLFIGEERLS